jgi:hypothetical protein
MVSSGGVSEHGIGPWVFRKGGEFLTGLLVIALSRNTLHHVVGCLGRIWKKF